MMGVRRISRGAFTLVEVLVVLALIGVLAGSVIGFLWDLWGRRDALTRASADAQAGTAVLERMETDIMSGLAGDQSAGAGAKGTASSLRLLSRGLDVPVKGNGSTVGDLQASEYRFEGGTLKARRWNIVRGGGEPDFETVCDHVEGARLRYFDGQQWKESFDSLSAGGLPVAIEVAVWFGTPHQREDVGSPARAARPAAAAETEKEEPAAGASRDAKPSTTTDASLPVRQPDRLRVIVVPDGPVAAWKEAR